MDFTINPFMGCRREMSLSSKDAYLKQTCKLATQWHSIVFEKPLIQSTFLFYAIIKYFI